MISFKYFKIILIKTNKNNLLNIIIMKIVINRSGIGLNLSLPAIEYLIKYKVIKSPLDMRNINRSNPRLVRCIEVLGDNTSLDMLETITVRDDFKYKISEIQIGNIHREIILME